MTLTLSYRFPKFRQSLLLLLAFIFLPIMSGGFGDGEFDMVAVAKYLIYSIPIALLFSTREAIYQLKYLNENHFELSWRMLFWSFERKYLSRDSLLQASITQSGDRYYQIEAESENGERFILFRCPVQTEATEKLQELLEFVKKDEIFV